MTPFARWLAAAALLVLAGIAVPYGLLSGEPHGLGILVFWLGFGLAVIALILRGVSGWRR
jgi:hypothetical protein